MTRVLPSIAKLNRGVRRIRSSALASRSSTLLNSHSQCLPRSIRDFKPECDKGELMTSGSRSEVVDQLIAHDLIHAHSTASGHRPSPSQAQSIIRISTLSKGFRTSAPLQTAHDTSTIDFFFFPDIPPPPPDNPFQKLRVPLLPDNYAPDRSANSGHEVETPDGALTRPEVVVVASHPEDVLPAALTEVVGNEAHERGIEELTKTFDSGVEVKEPGVIKELWAGLMDDVFGPKTPKKSA